MNFNFQKIKENKLREINILKQRRSLIRAIEKKRKEGQVPIIAEIKRSSPGLGKIREIEVIKAAIEIEKGGACAISVLTDNYFAGNLGDLVRVKEALALPVLRKDFIVDEFQIVQSYFAGADAILLIVSLLKAQTKKFVQKVHQLGMEALVELHSEKEIKFALQSEAKLIGINNRDLKTLKVNLATTEKLIPKIPKNKIIVAESGIESKEDLIRVLRSGAKAVLIGTSIMKAKNIKAKVKNYVTAR